MNNHKEMQVMHQSMKVVQLFKQLDQVSHELREMYRTQNFAKHSAKEREHKRLEFNRIIQMYEYESKKLTRLQQELHTAGEEVQV